MDYSIKRGEYWADLGRYGWFGPLPEDMARAHSRVLERQELIAAQVKPDRGMKNLYNSVPDDMPFEIHRISTEPSMPPFCGNAIQMVKREMKNCDKIGLTFESGQVICIEVWAGLLGGIEDMYRVETTGVVRLTSLARDIRVISNK